MDGIGEGALVGEGAGVFEEAVVCIIIVLPFFTIIGTALPRVLLILTLVSSSG